MISLKNYIKNKIINLKFFFTNYQGEFATYKSSFKFKYFMVKKYLNLKLLILNFRRSENYRFKLDEIWYRLKFLKNFREGISHINLEPFPVLAFESPFQLFRPDFQKGVHFQSFKVDHNWPRQHANTPQLEVPLYEGSTFPMPTSVDFDDYYTAEHFKVIKSYYQKKNLIVKSQGERLYNFKFFLRTNNFIEKKKYYSKRLYLYNFKKFKNYIINLNKFFLYFANRELSITMQLRNQELGWHLVATPFSDFNQQHKFFSKKKANKIIKFLSFFESDAPNKNFTDLFFSRKLNKDYLYYFFLSFFSIGNSKIKLNIIKIFSNKLIFLSILQFIIFIYSSFKFKYFFTIKYLNLKLDLYLKKKIKNNLNQFNSYDSLLLLSNGISQNKIKSEINELLLSRNYFNLFGFSPANSIFDLILTLRQRLFHYKFWDYITTNNYFSYVMVYRRLFDLNSLIFDFYWKLLGDKPSKVRSNLLTIKPGPISISRLGEIKSISIHGIFSFNRNSQIFLILNNLLNLVLTYQFSNFQLKFSSFGGNFLLLNSFNYRNKFYKIYLEKIKAKNRSINWDEFIYGMHFGTNFKSSLSFNLYDNKFLQFAINRSNFIYKQRSNFLASRPAYNTFIMKASRGPKSYLAIGKYDIFDLFISVTFLNRNWFEYLTTAPVPDFFEDEQHEEDLEDADAEPQWPFFFGYRWLMDGWRFYWIAYDYTFTNNYAKQSHMHATIQALWAEMSTNDDNHWLQHGYEDEHLSRLDMLTEGGWNFVTVYMDFIFTKCYNLISYGSGNLQFFLNFFYSLIYYLAQNLFIVNYRLLAFQASKLNLNFLNHLYLNLGLLLFKKFLKAENLKAILFFMFYCFFYEFFIFNGGYFGVISIVSCAILFATLLFLRLKTWAVDFGQYYLAMFSFIHIWLVYPRSSWPYRVENARFENLLVSRQNKNFILALPEKKISELNWFWFINKPLAHSNKIPYLLKLNATNKFEFYVRALSYFKRTKNVPLFYFGQKKITLNSSTVTSLSHNFTRVNEDYNAIISLNNKHWSSPLLISTLPFHPNHRIIGRKVEKIIWGYRYYYRYLLKVPRAYKYKDYYYLTVEEYYEEDDYPDLWLKPKFRNWFGERRKEWQKFDSYEAKSITRFNTFLGDKKSFQYFSPGESEFLTSKLYTYFNYNGIAGPFNTPFTRPKTRVHWGDFLKLTYGTKHHAYHAHYFMKGGLRKQELVGWMLNFQGRKKFYNNRFKSKVAVFVFAGVTKKRKIRGAEAISTGNFIWEGYLPRYRGHTARGSRIAYITALNTGNSELLTFHRNLYFKLFFLWDSMFNLNSLSAIFRTKLNQTETFEKKSINKSYTRYAIDFNTVAKFDKTSNSTDLGLYSSRFQSKNFSTLMINNTNNGNLQLNSVFYLNKLLNFAPDEAASVAFKHVHRHFFSQWYKKKQWVGYSKIYMISQKRYLYRPNFIDHLLVRRFPYIRIDRYQSRIAKIARADQQKYNRVFQYYWPYFAFFRYLTAEELYGRFSQRRVVFSLSSGLSPIYSSQQWHWKESRNLGNFYRPPYISNLFLIKHKAKVKRKVRKKPNILEPDYIYYDPEKLRRETSLFADAPAWWMDGANANLAGSAINLKTYAYKDQLLNIFFKNPTDFYYGWDRSFLLLFLQIKYNITLLTSRLTALLELIDWPPGYSLAFDESWLLLFEIFFR
jgi:hypothetical protein